VVHPSTLRNTSGGEMVLHSFMVQMRNTREIILASPSETVGR